MTPLRAVSVVVFALSSLQCAVAADDARAVPAVPKVVHGVTLAKVCDGCGVIADVRTETRKGKGSGVGAVGGALAGGLVGNQLGGGSGKTALTVLGAVGGGFAGNEVEKNMKKHTVWIATVRFKDGSTRHVERDSDPGLKAGDVVRLDNGNPVKQPR